jgi:serine protease Do
MSRIVSSLSRSSRTWLVVVLSVALGSGLTWSVLRGPLGSPAEAAIGPHPELKAMEQGFIDIAAAVAPAVVSITVDQTVRAPAGGSMDEFFRGFPFFQGPSAPESRRGKSQGSGVIIDPDGYILTNGHVITPVQGAQKVAITVTLADGEEYPAEVVGVDADTDLAIVKISAGKPLPAAVLGDADKVRVGQWAIAIGNPLEFAGTVTVGVISATGRELRPESSILERNLLQTDAAINHGNSGGPLVNSDGEVIGINQAIASTTGANIGLGFSVSINAYTKEHVIRPLMKGERVVRGLLGVKLNDVDAAIRDVYGVPGGAIVIEVVPGSPADDAKLMNDDVITEFNGQPVKDAGDFTTMVQRTAPGTVATLKIFRDGNPMEVKVRIGERNPATAASPTEAAPAENLLGMQVQPFTARIAEQLGVKMREGVIIAAVDPTGDAAAKGGLGRGDIIVAINRAPITDINSYQAAIRKLKPGDNVVIVHWRQDQRAIASFTLSK